MVEGGTMLHDDGLLIVRSLLRKAEFFGRQYDPANPNETLIKAVKRQFVIDVLASLNLQETALSTLMEIATHDD